MIPEPLQKQLESPHRSERRAAAAALREVGSAARAAVPIWAAHLTDPDPWLRLNAGAALVDLGLTHAHRLGPAVPALRAALTDKDAKVRRYAVQALGRAGAPSVPDVVALLADGDAGVRSDACSALARLKTPAAARALAGALGQDDKTAEAALRSLGRIGEAASGVVAPLIAQALSGGSLTRRALAASALRAVGARDQAWGPLEAALQEPPQRLAAARALARIATEADHERIASMLADPALRPEVLAGLESSPPAFWPALQGCMDDPSAGVQRAAAKLLAPAAFREPFASFMRRHLHDPDPVLQTTAIHALGAAGDLAALPTLLSLLETDQHARDVILALEGYRDHPDAILPPLVAAAQGDAHRSEAIRSIGSFGGAVRAVLPELLALLPSTNDEDSCYVLRALGWVPGEPRVIDALCEGLLEGGAMTGMAAAEALGRLGPHAGAGADALIGFLHANREAVAAGSFVAAWEAAMLAVGRISSPEAVPLLCSLLGTPLSMFDEVAVIDALGRHGGAKARAQLMTHAADDPPVRAALSVARVRLGAFVGATDREAGLSCLAAKLDLNRSVIDEPDELVVQALLEDIAVLAPGLDPAATGVASEVRSAIQPLERDPWFSLLSPWVSAALGALP